MRWFMTVGVPGGEYAVKADDPDKAWNALSPVMGFSGDGPLTRKKVNEALKANGYEAVTLRPAPPDLVEWLECGVAQMAYQNKVQGGWLRHLGGDIPVGVFVPVRGADGITVLTSEE